MLHIVDRRTEIEDVDAIQPPGGNGRSTTERATLGIPPGLRGLPAIPIPRFMEHGVVGSEPEDVDAVGTPGGHGWHAIEDTAQSLPL